MDRRTFLQSVAPGIAAHTKGRQNRPLAFPPEGTDDDFLRDVAHGRTRWIGSLSPTGEVVVSAERTGPRTSLTRFSTIEDYSHPESVDDQSPQCVRAFLREPTVSIIGPTPYVSR